MRDMIKELLDKVTFSQRTTVALCFISLILVLLNNYVFLKILEDREARVTAQDIKITARENALVSRERILRLWEIELIAKGEQCREVDTSQPKQKPSPASRLN